MLKFVLTNMTKASLQLLFFSVLLMASCRTNTEEKVLKGDEYFPIRVGDVRYYAIDTVVYDLFQKQINTISHTVKEEVVEKFLDASSDTIYRLELSTYNTQKVDWIVFRSFERKVKDNYALEKMENQTEVKLLFPVAQYKTKGSTYTWNLNMFNNKEPLLVKYSSVFSSYYNGINAYNDCITTKLNKPRTGIVNNTREEVYAKNIGLVYRFVDSTDYLLNDSFPSGKKIFVRLKN